MALGIENISTDLVGTTLGTSSRDVGALCNHPQVNRWSKYKPIIYGNSAHSTGGALPYNSGLMVKADSKSIVGSAIYYFVPVNLNNILSLESNLDVNGDPTLTEQDLYGDLKYRLGDFRLYNHSAKKPSLEENPPGLTVPPGEKENATLSLLLEGDSLEIIKCLLSTSTPYDEVWIFDRFVFGGEWFSYDQLFPKTFLRVDKGAFSTTGYDALFPFEQQSNQILSYEIPYFTGISQPAPKIYLDQEDALANGGVKEYNYVRELVVPSYFNKYTPDGSRNFTRFRDVPLRPVITGGITNLIIRGFRLFCQIEDEMGIPPHYTVFLNADGDFTGEFVVQIKFDVYEINWQTKTIGNLIGSTNWTNDGWADNNQTNEVPQNIGSSLQYYDGIYGENSMYFHLRTPLTAGVLPIDSISNTGLDNYNIINNRINNYAVKTYIDFIRY